MNKSPRPFSFANPSFLSAVLAAAMMIASSRSASAEPAPAAEAERAARVFSATGIGGGVIVHLGATDGKFTAALKVNDHCCVQGLTTDAAACDAARQYIQSRGLYGTVSVATYDGKHLPYVDNLAALVVVDDPSVPMAEVMRVLRPLGAAVLNRAGRDEVTVKPWPEEYDEWQQHYHGPDNNAVAHDTAVGPPRRYQWIAFPQWQRSHHIMPSMNSLLASQSRLYTVEDVASAEHPALPGKYALICRDAFSGIELWRVPFRDWHSTLIYDKNMPVQLQRRCAAIGDTVYCTPGYFALVAAFDAATGAVKHEYPATKNTTEFVYDRGTLYVVTGEPTYNRGEGTDALGSSKFAEKLYGPRVITFRDPKSTIAAIDAASGKTLWKKSGEDTAGYLGATLAVSGDYVVLYTGAGVTAWDRDTGKTLWNTPAPVSFFNATIGIAISLVLSEDGAYMADGKQLRAFRLSDGKELWSAPATFNHHKEPDVFLTGGLVWAAGYNANKGQLTREVDLTYMGVNGYDPDTGKLVKQIPQRMIRPMGHDRCYRNRITDSYYINSATGGSDYLEFGTGTELPHPWVRGTCGIGFMPCNGLLYAGPPSCSCCNWVMLNALNALAPEPGLTKSNGPVKVKLVTRLEKGPAFGKIRNSKSEIRKEDWPTYRHDDTRSGVSKDRVGSSISRQWELRLAGRPSAPVIAAGTLFVADIDAHQLCAFNAQTGEPLWKFSAGGRIDSPPAYADGFVYFGSRDGAVYSLRASDGALAWRFTPLPGRVICAYEQLESAWPVNGTVLLKDGLVYFAAGRNSFLDGGIFVYALDMKTGEVRHQRRMYGPFGEDTFPVLVQGIRAASGIYGFKADVPVDGGTCVYFKQQAFLPDLTPVEQTAVKNRHLIPNPGFLESIPQHRSFWTLDTVTRYDIPTGLAGVHGDILVVDGNRFIEVRGYRPARQTPFDPRVSGYALYCGIAGEMDADSPAALLAKAQANAKGKKAGKMTKAARRKIGALRLASAATQSKKIWQSPIPLTGKAMAMSENVVFVAGTPVVFPDGDIAKAYEGRMGGVLWLADAATGKKLAEYPLPAPPAWDSLAVANGSVYIALTDGRLLRFAGK